MAQLAQLWAGMSFGLIGLAHFGQKRLNLPIVILLLIVYVAYSNNALQSFTLFSDRQDQIVSDLAALPADEISGSTKLLIERWQEGVSLWQLLSYFVTFIGPFFGAIGYLLYCYRRQRVNR